MRASQTAALPPPTFHPLPKFGRLVDISQPIRPTAPSLPGRIRITGMRWAAFAATASLLLATAGGGYLATRGLGDGSSTRVTGFAAVSPVPSPPDGYVDPCPGQPYFPCGPSPEVGFAFVMGSRYSASATAGTDVTMFGWEIGADQTVTFDPNNPQVLPGIGIDIVLDGAYAATFSGPVTITRSHQGGSNFEYLDAGEPVELGKGDAVSFEQGSRVEIVNLMTSRPLVFKNIVVHGDSPIDSGAPGGARPVEGNPGVGDVTIEENGTGAIPMSIGDYPRGDFGIYLTYSQIAPGTQLPPNVGDSTLVMGPVDPTNFYSENGWVPDEGTEGYVVWTYILKG